MKRDELLELLRRGLTLHGNRKQKDGFKTRVSITVEDVNGKTLHDKAINRQLYSFLLYIKLGLRGESSTRVHQITSVGKVKIKQCMEGNFSNINVSDLYALFEYIRFRELLIEKNKDKIKDLAKGLEVISEDERIKNVKKIAQAELRKASEENNFILKRIDDEVIDDDLTIVIKTKIIKTKKE